MMLRFFQTLELSGYLNWSSGPPDCCRRAPENNAGTRVCGRDTKKKDLKET